MGLFATYSQKQIKKLEKTAKKIEDLAEKYAAMSDAELQATTPLLKERLQCGETLDDILPEAFAALRYAGRVSTRVLPSPVFISAILP